MGSSHAAQRLPFRPLENVQRGMNIISINKNTSQTLVLKDSPLQTGAQQSCPQGASQLQCRGPQPQEHSLYHPVVLGWREYQPTRWDPMLPGACVAKVFLICRARPRTHLVGQRQPAPLGDLAVAPRAVLGRALRGADGPGPPEAAALATAAPSPTGQRVGAPVHHDGVHAVGHREGLEVALDGDRQRQLVDEVHGGAGDDRPATEILQAEHCGRAKWRGSGSEPWAGLEA